MTLKGIVSMAAMVLALTCAVVAETQLGVYGLQSFTDHKRHPSPAGIGGYIQKDMSSIVTLRFSVQRGFDSDGYVATIYPNGWYSLPEDTIRDLWSQSSSMTTYDVSFLFRLLGHSIVSLSVGAAIGLVTMEFSADGRSSGFTFGDDSNSRIAFSGLLDFEIAPSSNSPVIFHLTVLERALPNMQTTLTDGGGGYLGQSVTSAEITFGMGLTFY